MKGERFGETQLNQTFKPNHTKKLSNLVLFGSQIMILISKEHVNRTDANHTPTIY